MINKAVVFASLVAAPFLFSVNTYAAAPIADGVADLVAMDPQAEQPSATSTENLKAATETPDDAALYVEEKAQAYIRGKKRKFATQGKQVFMHSGSALIPLKSTEADWGDARVMAYREALQKARERMLKQLYVDVSSKTIRSSFKTNQLPEFTAEELRSPNKMSALLDKLVALADATVDSKLEEQGIDPAQYAAAPPSKRKQMMEKAITNTVKTSARGDISGSQIMKSYEKTDSHGNTAVSVVIATSNKKKNFLLSLRKSKGNIQPEPTKAKISVEDYLEQHKANLMYQVGTKLLWDEQGYPVLLSFGMAGNDCNPADYDECVDGREFSFIDAELNAFSFISESYNLMGKVEAAKSTTSSKSKDAVVTLDSAKQSETQETTVAKVIKETQQMSQMTSSVKGLTGITQVSRWTAKHPVTNREINGVVLMWHPVTEQETRTFKAGKKAAKAKHKDAAKVSMTPSSGEGDEADDDDF